MRSTWMMARAFAMALLCLWAAGCVAIEAGHEGVLVEQPFFFGHGGVDPVPSKTGRVSVALTTKVIDVDIRPIRRRPSHHQRFV